MTVVIYRSTDASAPVLSGTTGALTALLNACLVTGYGSKAAAGWTKPFSGAAGQEAFRQGGSGFYWQIDDTGPHVTALQREARTRGYETMSAWGTGTGLFPTVAQLASGIIIRKSATADATARAWIVAADSRTCMLFTAPGDTAGVWSGSYFGDFYSYQVGDNYKCMIAARITENSAATTSDLFAVIVGAFNTSCNHYLARAYTQLGGSVLAQKFGDAFNQWHVVGGGPSNTMQGPITFPNPSTGGLYLAPIRIKDNDANVTGTLRGEVRGLFHQGHPHGSFTDGDTFDGVGEFAGRSFLLLKFAFGTTGVNTGVWCVETTDWPASP